MRTVLYRRAFELRFRLREQIQTVLLFSLLALVEIGLNPRESPWTYRTLSPTVAGLLAGPLVGLAVGMFTNVASTLLLGCETIFSSIGIIAGGLIGGWVARYRPQLQLKAIAGLVVGALSHAVWLGVVFMRDTMTSTWDALLLLYAPPIVLNGAAAALFLVVVSEMHTHLERIEKTELVRALRIANRVLPRLRYGLNPQSASYIADIIKRMTGAAGVCITDTKVVLATVGAVPSTCNGGGAIPNLSRKAMATAKVALSKEGELNPGCAAPLFYGDAVLGAVEIHLDSRKRVKSEVAELGQEIAQFLAGYQMQLAELEKQSVAASKAELRALQAQVHPHFLFNVLNTVAALCETSPRQAVDVLVRLGAYYRTALRKDGGLLIPLEEELENVRHYLEIEKIRFGSRLSVVEKIETDIRHILIPALSIQPVAENAILHGLSTKVGTATLEVIIRRRGERLVCWIADDGIGMTPEQLNAVLNHDGEPHGLAILRNRLDKIYHGQFRFKVRSRKGTGTVVLLSVPAWKANES